jgi:hypothetical protein
LNQSRSPTAASSPVPISRNLNLAAFTFYLLVSIVLFGLRVIGSPGTTHVGFGTDPAMNMWFIAWWPHAIWHHLNPFITYVVWPSTGYNLTWTGAIPAVAIALAPVTGAFGPVMAYNVASLLMPALSAWGAFLLCRHIARSFGAALAGGLIYGFSPYEVGQVLAGHLHMTTVFIPPLCVLLGLLLVEDRISALRFTIALAFLLALQCLISTEILATMTLFGALALLGAAVLVPRSRERVLAAVVPIGSAYVGAAIMLGPFLYYAFVKGSPPREPIFPPSFFSADLLSFVVPGQLTLLHPFGAERLAAHFTGTMTENGSYFGIPLLAVVSLWLWRRRREPAARLLAAILPVVIVCALGPMLSVDGRRLIKLPWAPISDFPLIEHALPVRFSSYGFLILAIVFSMVLSDREVPFKKAVATVTLISLFPNPAFFLRPSRYETPKFFADGLYRRFLRPGENVLVIPYGWNGPSTLWQAESEMYFRMPGAYVGPTPLEDFRKWPVSLTLTNSIPVPDAANQLRAFVATYGIDAILVANGATQVGRALPASLGLRPVEAGGVLLYHLHGLADGDTAQELVAFQRSAVDDWFTELLCAAKRFLATGHDLAKLNPEKLRSLGLLPDSEWSAYMPLLAAGAKHGTASGLWLGPGPSGTIAVGLPAWPSAAGPLISRFQPEAASVFYPYPESYQGTLPNDDAPHFLLMNLRAGTLQYCHANSTKWWPVSLK